VLATVKNLVVVVVVAAEKDPKARHPLRKYVRNVAANK
jgi:hypothetical protein